MNLGVSSLGNQVVGGSVNCFRSPRAPPHTPDWKWEEMQMVGGVLREKGENGFCFPCMEFGVSGKR